MSNLANDIVSWAGKARTHGRDRIEIDLATADEISRLLSAPPLTFDFANAFPDGSRDESSYSDVEEALDDAGAPSQDRAGRWLTIPQRIAALAKCLP